MVEMAATTVAKVPRVREVTLPMTTAIWWRGQQYHPSSIECGTDV